MNLFLSNGYRNLFEVLSNGERVIVYSDPELSTIVTWNHSLTFLFWKVKGEYFEEYEIMTMTPRDSLTYEQVRTLAKEHYDYLMND